MKPYYLPEPPPWELGCRVVDFIVWVLSPVIKLIAMADWMVDRAAEWWRKRCPR